MRYFVATPEGFEPPTPGSEVQILAFLCVLDRVIPSVSRGLISLSVLYFPICVTLSWVNVWVKYGPGGPDGGSGCGSGVGGSGAKRWDSNSRPAVYKMAGRASVMSPYVFLPDCNRIFQPGIFTASLVVHLFGCSLAAKLSIVMTEETFFSCDSFNPK